MMFLPDFPRFIQSKVGLDCDRFHHHLFEFIIQHHPTIHESSYWQRVYTWNAKYSAIALVMDWMAEHWNVSEYVKQSSWQLVPLEFLHLKRDTHSSKWRLKHKKLNACCGSTSLGLQFYCKGDIMWCLTGNNQNLPIYKWYKLSDQTGCMCWRKALKDDQSLKLYWTKFELLFCSPRTTV
jgi:hypothetical protein